MGRTSDALSEKLTVPSYEITNSTGMFVNIIDTPVVVRRLNARKLCVLSGGMVIAIMLSV
jgi:hypothetical protein